MVLPQVAYHTGGIITCSSSRFYGEGACIEHILHRGLSLPACSEYDDITAGALAVVDGRTQVGQCPDEDLLCTMLSGYREGSRTIGRREDDLTPADQVRRVLCGIIAELGEVTAYDIALGRNECTQTLTRLLGLFGRSYREYPLGSMGKGCDHRGRGSEDVHDDDDTIRTVVEWIELRGGTEIDLHRG